MKSSSDYLSHFEFSSRFPTIRDCGCLYANAACGACG
jgi:hypothetical protein